MQRLPSLLEFTARINIRYRLSLPLTENTSTNRPVSLPNSKILRGAITLYGLLSLSASLLPETSRAWGINHLHFLPSGFSYLVAAGFLLLLLLPDRILQKGTEAINQTLWPRPASGRWTVPLFAGLGGIVLFWLFRSETLLLGDGQILVTDAGGLGRSSGISDIMGMALQTRTPLSTLIYFFAAQTGRFQLGLDVTTTFQLISCFAGGVYVMTLLWFLGWGTASAGARVAGLGLLLFTGAIMLSFGYVESYPLFFLSTFLYAVLALRSISQSRSLFLPGIVLLLSILLHAAGSALIPSFLFLLLLRYGGESLRKFTQPRGVLTGVSALFLLILAWWFLSGAYELRGNFLPLISLDVRNTYTLFSFEHLLDYANMLFLLCGVGLLFTAVMLIRRSARSLLKSSSFLFLIIMTVFQQLFVFTANTDIGFGRDWDVMISMGAGVLLLLFILMREGDEQESVTGSDALRFSGAMLLTVLPWIAVNASGESTARRFESLLELDKRFVGDYRTAYGYEVLAIHWRDRGNARREQTFFGKAIEASDNIRFYENAVISLNGYAGQPDPEFLTRIARRFHREVLTTGADTSSDQFQDHLSMYYVTLRMMRENGLCAEALPMYREAVEAKLPEDGYAVLGIAHCTAEMGERGKAAELYKNLSTTGLDIVVKDWEIMGEVLLEAKEYPHAVSAFEQAMAKGSVTERVYLGLYRGLLGVGRKGKASEVAAIYQRIFPDGQFKEAMALQ